MYSRRLPNCISYAFYALGIDKEEKNYRPPPSLKEVAQLFRRTKPGETPDAYLAIGNGYRGRAAMHIAVVDKDNPRYATHRPCLGASIQRVPGTGVIVRYGECRYSISTRREDGFLPEHKIAVKLRRKP